MGLSLTGTLGAGIGLLILVGAAGLWVQAPGAPGSLLLALLPPVGYTHTRGPGEGSCSAPTMSASFPQSW